MQLATAPKCVSLYDAGPAASCSYLCSCVSMSAGAVPGGVAAGLRGRGERRSQGRRRSRFGLGIGIGIGVGIERRSCRRRCVAFACACVSSVVTSETDSRWSLVQMRMAMRTWRAWAWAACVSSLNPAHRPLLPPPLLPPLPPLRSFPHLLGQLLFLILCCLPACLQKKKRKPAAKKKAAMPVFGQKQLARVLGKSGAFPVLALWSGMRFQTDCSVVCAHSASAAAGQRRRRRRRSRPLAADLLHPCHPVSLQIVIPGRSCADLWSFSGRMLLVAVRCDAALSTTGRCWSSLRTRPSLPAAGT